MTISGTAKLGTKKSGACFEKGKTYPTQLYMDWIDWYLQYVRENDCSPSERQVSRQFDISRKTAKKVCEFASNKTNYLHNIPFYAKGYGSRSLSDNEQNFKFTFIKIFHPLLYLNTAICLMSTVEKRFMNQPSVDG